ncbi:hypothetical protein C7974DRAFT_147791 [Boeremia exigua]|uniref:uncharacterized protein n=1 Tax=Boeremia exigua TaxID=749465 RepID=UPI001E8E9349|nr:uncharacterized protein C7974DRAFT_147791 [Boeremia exigua]KAH6637758.1 hypothetical protein C7974DRAFT_147791 [Boeremia exigua]
MFMSWPFDSRLPLSTFLLFVPTSPLTSGYIPQPEYLSTPQRVPWYERHVEPTFSPYRTSPRLTHWLNQTD